VKPVTPRRQYLALSEEEVRAALADPDPKNPIAVEIARLMRGYAMNFVEHCEAEGDLAPVILRRRGDSPIERIAMELATLAIRQELGTA